MLALYNNLYQVSVKIVTIILNQGTFILSIPDNSNFFLTYGFWLVDNLYFSLMVLTGCCSATKWLIREIDELVLPK